MARDDEQQQDPEPHEQEAVDTEGAGTDAATEGGAAGADGRSRGDGPDEGGSPSGTDGHRASEERQKGGVATDGPRGEQESDEEAQEILERFEEDPPSDPKDWPGGRAKYLTIGGDNPSAEYEDGPEGNLGPPDLRRHEDGSITVKGEPVDDPEQYKRAESERTGTEAAD